ncbi:MAG: Coenzyme F420 hydrogenase/dehydrogenase, beta subunit C-terminal domain [Syntrophales bacterium]|nr:Coenzyme F420 hydrogenase/dehydrogenase, beta subunit C-terminal domain [Syntrophales bacterium]MCK9528626.1 Coenzyme F420 hydrogenase/dehydrogenase, beta subunit C-terminal domain [Syntrophales bacterium]MDX9923067.1 Coenzyme F420 hydrogenase/dehydrogenase, beta subunit C-terminal domain [Syntrophales bacterium]
MEYRIKGQKELDEQVRDRGLCTGCGACVNLCPYRVFYRDRTITLNPCDIPSGRCYAFCPRTPVDLDEMRRRFFEQAEFTPEIGPVKDFCIARATDEATRESSQHGGVVSALMTLALEEGLIDTAIVSEGREGFLKKGVALSEPDEILKRGKSTFIVSPVIAEFNRVAQGDAGAIGVAATPCQAFALSRMRLKPDLPSGDNPIDKLRIVIGLFCGFTLSQASLVELLKESSADPETVTGMEIPSGRDVLEVYTNSGLLRFPLAVVQSFIREGCHFCIDTTAEYADLSVGSARFSERWEENRSWNQVIVRTARGMDLLTMAREKGILEFRHASPENLETLKRAAAEKKRQSLKNLAEKSGNPRDLIYLDADDAVLAALTRGDTHVEAD